MINSRLVTAIFGLGMSLALTGCNNKAGSIAEPPKLGATSTSNSTSGDSTKAGGAPSTTSVPVDLKHDAYSYNGFDRVKPLTYLFAQVQGDKPTTGTQVSELKTSDKDSATFLTKRTGSLEFLGEDEVLVKSDGLYLVSTSQGKPEKPVRQMPAKLTVGTVWDYEYNLLSNAGKKMYMKGKARVEAEEKIKVTGGEFDTLRVSETANLDNDGSKAEVAMKTWYAKNLGIVKMKMELKTSTGRLITTTMELSGTGE